MSELEITSNEEKNNLVRALDVHFWSEELNVRAEELKEIIKLVGPSIHDVRVYLSKKLMLSWTAAY